MTTKIGLAFCLLVALSLHPLGCADSRSCTAQYVPAIEIQVRCTTFSPTQEVGVDYKLSTEEQWSACPPTGTDMCQNGSETATWKCSARTSEHQAVYDVALTVEGEDFGEPVRVTVQHDGCHPATEPLILPATEP